MYEEYIRQHAFRTHTARLYQYNVKKLSLKHNVRAIRS